MPRNHRLQAISDRRARLLKRRSNASTTWLDQEYSPSVANDVTFDDSLSPDDSPPVCGVIVPCQSQAKREEKDSFYDEYLLEEEKHGAINRECQTQMDRMIETVQMSIETVTPIVTQLSDTSRDLFCYSPGTNDDARSHQLVSSKSHSQPIKEKQAPRDRSFVSNDSGVDGAIVKEDGGYWTCDVFSVMERQMDHMDEECAALDESATARSEPSNKNPMCGVGIQSSPTDVRKFYQGPDFDSSLETTTELEADDGKASAATQQRSCHKHPDAGTVNSRDSTPCRRNNQNHSSAGETTSPVDETTNHQHQQLLWQHEVHRTIAQARDKPPRNRRSIVLRFLGRKLKQL
jgi:hypothetical protein